MSIEARPDRTSATSGATAAERAPVFRARGVTKIYHMGEIQVHALGNPAALEIISAVAEGVRVRSRGG